MTEDLQILLESIQGIQLLYQVITASEIGVGVGVLAYFLWRAEKRIAQMLKEFVRSKLDHILSEQLEKIILSELKAYETELKESVRNELNRNGTQLEDVMRAELSANEAHLKELIRTELKTNSGISSYRKQLGGGK